MGNYTPNPSMTQPIYDPTRPFATPNTMLAIVVEFQLSSCKSSRSCSSQLKKKKKKRKHWEEREGWISFGGHLCTIFGCRGLYWGIKVVKSVKKDIKSRVESKGLYRGIMVVIFFFFLNFWTVFRSLNTTGLT